MGGEGARFKVRGYKTYKSFLPINSKETIFDNIENNFNSDTHIIVIGSSYQVEKNFLHKKKYSFIKIIKHKKGPLYSIFLALDQLNKIIEHNQNIFICYTDINWKWKPSNMRNIISTEACVLTHKGFHPHLEVNEKSDFCVIRNNHVIKIKQKRTNFKDYKIDNLAIGCYFFKSLNYINFFFSQFKKKIFSIKKEFYLLTLINFLIKNKIKISNFEIKKFVHLGFPEQYEDFLKWNKRIKYTIIKPLSTPKNSIMLMCGKGKRVRGLKEKKPFLKIENKKFYKLIFEKFNTKQNIIITTNNYYQNIDKKKFKIYKIKQTESMIETLKSSKNILLKNSKYFLLSCDCFGDYDHKEFQKLSKDKNLDLIIFAFKKSYFNSKFKNAHTSILINKNKVEKISVKKNLINSYGHAGFFWINSSKLFQNLDNFLMSKNFKKLSSTREVIIDDYFKFLLENKLAKIKSLILKDYVHLGSEKEFHEYQYWKNYFL